MNGVQRIAKEYTRQRRKEGYSKAHDRHHEGEELARAGALYAIPADRRDPSIVRYLYPAGWAFKPTDRIHELEKAGALIAAEIDRILWLAGKEAQGD